MDQSDKSLSNEKPQAQSSVTVHNVNRPVKVNAVTFDTASPLSKLIQDLHHGQATGEISRTKSVRMSKRAVNTAPAASIQKSVAIEQSQDQQAISALLQQVDGKVNSSVKVVSAPVVEEAVKPAIQSTDSEALPIEPPVPQSTKPKIDIDQPRPDDLPLEQAQRVHAQLKTSIEQLKDNIRDIKEEDEKVDKFVQETGKKQRKSFADFMGKKKDPKPAEELQAPVTEGTGVKRSKSLLARAFQKLTPSSTSSSEPKQPSSEGAGAKLLRGLSLRSSGKFSRPTSVIADQKQQQSTEYLDQAKNKKEDTPKLVLPGPPATPPTQEVLVQERLMVKKAQRKSSVDFAAPDAIMEQEEAGVLATLGEEPEVPQATKPALRNSYFSKDYVVAYVPPSDNASQTARSSPSKRPESVSALLDSYQSDTTNEKQEPVKSVLNEEETKMLAKLGFGNLAELLIEDTKTHMDENTNAGKVQRDEPKSEQQVPDANHNESKNNLDVTVETILSGQEIVDVESPLKVVELQLQVAPITDLAKEFESNHKKVSSLSADQDQKVELPQKQDDQLVHAGIILEQPAIVQLYEKGHTAPVLSQESQQELEHAELKSPQITTSTIESKSDVIVTEEFEPDAFFRTDTVSGEVVEVALTQETGILDHEIQVTIATNGGVQQDAVVEQEVDSLKQAVSESQNAIAKDGSQAVPAQEVSLDQPTIFEGQNKDNVLVNPLSTINPEQAQALEIQSGDAVSGQIVNEAVVVEPEEVDYIQLLEDAEAIESQLKLEVLDFDTTQQVIEVSTQPLVEEFSEDNQLYLAKSEYAVLVEETNATIITTQLLEINDNVTSQGLQLQQPVFSVIHETDGKSLAEQVSPVEFGVPKSQGEVYATETFKEDQAKEVEVASYQLATQTSEAYKIAVAQQETTDIVEQLSIPLQASANDQIKDKEEVLVAKEDISVLLAQVQPLTDAHHPEHVEQVLKDVEIVVATNDQFSELAGAQLVESVSLLTSEQNQVAIANAIDSSKIIDDLEARKQTLVNKVNGEQQIEQITADFQSIGQRESTAANNTEGLPFNVRIKDDKQSLPQLSYPKPVLPALKPKSKFADVKSDSGKLVEVESSLPRIAPKPVNFAPGVQLKRNTSLKLSQKLETSHKDLPKNGEVQSAKGIDALAKSKLVSKFSAMFEQKAASEAVNELRSQGNNCVSKGSLKGSQEFGSQQNLAQVTPRSAAATIPTLAPVLTAPKPNFVTKPTNMHVAK